MNHDPDAYKFRQLDEQVEPNTFRRSIPGGSVPAWLCECFQSNGINVFKCNNCGKPKPEVLKSYAELIADLKARRIERENQ